MGKSFNDSFGDYDKLFVLYSWGLVNDQVFLDKLPANDTDDKNGFDNVVKFLCGKTVYKDTVEFLLFFNKNMNYLIRFVGKYITSVHAVDFALSLPFNEIIDLWHGVQNLDNELVAVIEKIVLFKVEKLMRKKPPYDYPLTNLPEEFIVKVLSDLSFINDPEIHTKLENKCTSSIRMMLQDMVFRDLNDDNIVLKDNHFDKKKRLVLWTRINHILLNQINMQEQLPIFESILMTSLHLKESTKPFLQIKTETQIQMVYFHEAVVKRFGPGVPNLAKILNATTKDVSLLTDLLYTSCEAKDVVGKLTLAVFEMALALQIRDVSGFLFRDYVGKRFPPTDNMKDILLIAIRSENDHFLTGIANEFDKYFGETDKFAALNGFEESEFVYFLKNYNVSKIELDKYYMSLSWAFKKANIRLVDPRCTPPFYPQVKVNFDKVSHVISLTKINNLSEILEHGYITYCDVLEAKNKTLAGNEDSTSKRSTPKTAAISCHLP